MKLYHFTAAHLLPHILKEGITRGGVLDECNGVFVVRTGFLWLTTNPLFYAQEWSQGSRILYDRSACRITVNVPKAAECSVLNWLDFCQTEITPSVAEMLNAFGDPENWRLYRGQIRPSWLGEVESKPTLLLPARKYLEVRNAE